MKLKTLIQGLPVQVKGSKEAAITGLSADSRKTAPGNLFVAKRGGDAFIPQAVDNGAAVLLATLYNPFIKLPQLIHPDPGAIEPLLADRFYRSPSKELFLFGVTGTNGKTTTTYLVKHLLDRIGRSCGLVGTVETILRTRRSFSTLTTHDILSNHKLLREMANDGCKAASFEVSSHGLDQGRVEEMAFDAALFTNLTPDHLDYHKNMDEYALAKRRLFELLDKSPKKNKIAIANGDDPATLQMLQGIQTPRLLFGLGPAADLRAESIEFSAAGTRFTACYKQEKQLFSTRLIGRFNVYNLLGAIALGAHLGRRLSEMARHFADFSGVPGRLERVENRTGKHVFVDYAHTGDALENVLSTLREIARGKIHTVFGAGGGRDLGRRSGLAKAAEKLSDHCIITSDNPRNEDPEEICRQILAAIREPSRVCVELDRKRAIERAIAEAAPGDLVLIAGKGHEKVQIFAHRTVPFDDVAVALASLEAEE